MIHVRLAQMLTGPTTIGTTTHKLSARVERRYFYRDLDLPSTTLFLGARICWWPGGEGVVKGVRILTDARCAWHAFPIAGSPLVEVWIEDTTTHDIDTGSLLLERDGWHLGDEKRRIARLRGETD